MKEDARREEASAVEDLRGIDEIADASLVVERGDDGPRPVLFLKLRAGARLDIALRRRIVAAVHLRVEPRQWGLRMVEVPAGT
jgi:hypothetical protein